MNLGGIYEIVNTTNGKRYIGSAVNLKSRWGQHRRTLNLGTHRNLKLQRAWNKYGEAVFQFLPLMTVKDPTQLTLWENRFFRALKPEYNIALNATAPMLGRKHSPGTKVKQSIAKKGKKLGPQPLEQIANRVAANTGKKRSPEQCARMSEAAVGRKCPPPFTSEHRANISAANIGKHNIPHTPETLVKMSRAKKGKPWTPARRAAQERRSGVQSCS